jgi:hypothetical protein
MRNFYEGTGFTRKALSGKFEYRNPRNKQEFLTSYDHLPSDQLRGLIVFKGKQNCIAIQLNS